jgi:hypothetical protein
MTNLLREAMNCDDADHAAKLIQDALGIEWPRARSNIVREAAGRRPLRHGRQQMLGLDLSIC